MPNEMTDGYQIECLSCGYVWDTKYPQISAKCPSCNSRIYGTGNYTILTQHVHYELTEKEREEREKRIVKIVIIAILGFFIFISLITSSLVGFFILSAILGTFLYIFYKGYKEPVKKKL